MATSTAVRSSGRGHEDRPRRTGARSTSRDTGAPDEPTGAARLSAAADSLGKLIRLAAWIVAAIIAVGVLLVVLKANPNNGIVSAVRAVAHDLAGPFTGMFQVKPPRASVAVNSGIAAAVYVLAGVLVARIIAAIGTLGLRRHGGAPLDRRSETTSAPSTQASR